MSDKKNNNTKDDLGNSSSIKEIKKYRVTNKNNSPYDLHIGKNCYRLEPRNKKGDSIIISENQKNHPDIKSCLNKVIIKEVK